ncbi:hypothetical protein GVX82_00285 [Patescibacteria group bacterium]|jgi:hypothetical protein|nr:hypothetical protein [Patescibacteria group bacterium]
MLARNDPPHHPSERTRTPPTREQVFLTSLRYHGYRLTHKRSGLKENRSYAIPATRREDAEGIDLWVKPRGVRELIPVQITQRGTRLFAKYHRPAQAGNAEFSDRAAVRLREKRSRCRRHEIAFVIVRDHDGVRPSRAIAWGDVKALHFGLRQLVLERKRGMR